ncbi:ImmA/IrrE family metallo-endopeptidase [Actinoplanes sp. RD1]|uniref:ImmA/IrrE family metallo-endopeptidase n=1 Tax=Actinoplanes sp. RD1 TaxID=3064538 RepID=UPI0027418467|nr:ImmA/IrrE family metallo-endopeptidase [Actinoplanes sp. RD1]
MAELAETLSLHGDQSWLYEALSGHAEPSISQYAALSLAIDVPLAVLTGSVSVERSFAVALRAGLLHDGEDVKQVTGYAARALDDLELLLSWFPEQRNERLQLLKLAKRACSWTGFALKAGRQTAENFRDILEISDGPILDMAFVVESLGIPVILTPMPESLHGITVRDDSGRSAETVIMVNSNDWWGRQRFTLAHELCHVLFEDSGTLTVNEKQAAAEAPNLNELRADVFARHLLAPNGAVRKFWRSSDVSSRRSMSATLGEFMLRFGMSWQASVVTLSDCCGVSREALQDLKPGRIEDLMRDAGLERRWLDACLGQNEPAPSSWMLSMALEAYASGLVSSSVVASVLGRDDVAAVEEELRDEGWISDH